MKKLTLYSIIFILTLTSCKKCKNEQNKPLYTITGRVMQDCNTPYSNQYVSLYQQVSTSGNSGGKLVSSNTDANGYFTLEYTPDNSGTINLRSSSDNILTDIPKDQNLELGNVYINSLCKMNIKIKVFNNYSTRTDTFNCGPYGIANPFIMKTPLHDTIFPQILSSTLLISEYPNTSKSKIDLRWWFGNKNNAINLTSELKYLQSCNVNADTVEIKIY